MIKIEKVNKYYNKGKANQIHVIDNTAELSPLTGRGSRDSVQARSTVSVMHV